MEEQIENQQDYQQNKPNTALLITVSVIITALIVGGIVYFLINSKAQSTVLKLNSQISQNNQKQNELNQQISILKEQLTQLQNIQTNKEKRSVDQNQQSQTSQNNNQNSSINSWKTYENNSYGLNFDYPNTYKVTKENNFAPGLILGRLILVDDSRLGNPTLDCTGSPDGRGGPQPTDILYKTKIENNKLIITNREVIPENIGNKDDKTYIEFQIGDLYCNNKYDSDPNDCYYELTSTSANGILCWFIYSEDNYEDEAKNIINTINISKPDIYGKK